MTTNERFKKRVRARMAKTGERYNAARRALLETTEPRPAAWVSPPEMSDDAIRTATGKGWNEWRELLDLWGGREAGHSAIAAHVESTYGLNGWWSQAVTVSYERITGLRLPNQMADGTFTANKSRTITGSAADLRAMLDDDRDRADLFGGMTVERRSRLGVKTPRFAVGTGIASIAVAAKSDDRLTITIQHQKLDSADEVARWKHFWDDWLDSLDSAAR